MINHEQLLQFLELPGIEIERIALEKNHVLKIYVNSIKDGCHCRLCGKPIDHDYGLGQEITLRHLPMFGYKTYLVLKPKRYRCHACDDRPTTTQPMDWYTFRSAFATAYENDILLSLINSTVQDVSLKHEIGSDAIQGILDRKVHTKTHWEAIHAIEVIGIDEIALKKGHQNFVAIVSAYIHDRLQVLGILDDRKKDTVEAFFRGIPKRFRQTVKMVCADLYQGFSGAAKAVFGKRVAVCADRFHVAKLYRNGVDSLRKTEMKR